MSTQGWWLVVTEWKSPRAIDDILITLLPALFAKLTAALLRPGAEAQEWHSDGAHFGREAGWGDEEVRGRRLHLCMVVWDPAISR